MSQNEIPVSEEEIKAVEEEVKTFESFKNAFERDAQKDITTLLRSLLVSSVVLDASDIHIEPEEERTKLRIRVDGILHDILFFEGKHYKGLLSRIKLVSGLKLNITQKSQDGRFTLLFGKEEIEMRVSTLPSEYGESIAIRILNPKGLMGLEELGLRKEILDIFNKQIAQPNGMIIVTGPTGCGKTTTLYAALKKIQKSEIKIITIEDPIEYHLEGISQSQVNPKKGYDFATGLQTIVRQDPDVILVGEIRDKETATISLQAALTGHLVLTTLHTNDAAGTIVRLMALGEKPSNIAPALNLAVAQRLVRKVCRHCSSLKAPSKGEEAYLKQNLKSLAKRMPKAFKIPETKGCIKCNNTGYKGRTGIYEFFLIDDEMEAFIAKSPSIAELRKKAEQRGMITVKQDGLLKAIEGITTLEEVKRVAGE